MDGRSPRDGPSPSALRWRGSLAATHPLASAASPPVPRPPSLPGSTESDNRDAFSRFSETSRTRASRREATAAFVHDVALSVWNAFRSIAIEPNTVTVSDVSNADTNADTDDDAAYREVLAAARGAGRGRPQRRDGLVIKTRKKFSALMATRGLRRERIRFSPLETDNSANGFSSCPASGRRRRAARRAAWRRPRWTSLS